jgi:hypothetical protein
MQSEQDTATRLEHPQQLPDPRMMHGFGKMGKDRQTIDKIERGIRIIQGRANPLVPKLISGKLVWHHEIILLL